MNDDKKLSLIESLAYFGCMVLAAERMFNFIKNHTETQNQQITSTCDAESDKQDVQQI